MTKLIGFYDTETTGLPGPMGMPLEHQPHIIEIYVEWREFETLDYVDDFHTLIKPPVAIPDFITKITGITDLDVYNAPPMKKVFKKISRIWEDLSLLVAQNFRFDQTMVNLEGMRLGKKAKWPKAFCTVEQTLHIRGRRMKQVELYELMTNGQAYNAHRAKDDVKAMIEIYRWIKTNDWRG